MLKRLLLPLLAVLVVFGLVIWLLPAGTLFQGGQSALIIYDEPDPYRVDEDKVDALMLRQLLGHFSPKRIEMVSTGEYKKDQAKKFDIVFYVGTKPEMPLPTYLLDDLFYRTKPVIWIGANLYRMGERHSMDKYGLQMTDNDDSYATNRVEYKGRSLWKLDTRTYAVEIINQQKCEVLAWAIAEAGAELPAGRTMYGPQVTHAGQPVVVEPETSDVPELPEKLTFGVTPVPSPEAKPQPPIRNGAAKLPWIVKGEDMWYVASNPFSYHIEGGAYLAFCDVLHDMFGTGVEEDHPAFVRIEDVHARRNAADLIAAADFLHDKDIPFGFTLIPVYVNPALNETIFLSSDPDFLATVRGLIERGGMPILHGYTHQNQAETAVDYEFWSGPEGLPVSTGPEYASERVIRGLSECFFADIYPLAWTTPHYAASQIDYAAFRNYFTTAVERRQPIDRLGSDQFFPYVIYSDMHQQIIIPENLGYVQPAAGRDAQAILVDAENGLVVRDGWASFFFHSFLDLQLLADVVEGIEDLGYHWVSLADYTNKVRTEDTVVVSGVTEVNLDLKSQYLHEFTIEPGGEFTSETYSYRPVTGKVEKYASVSKRNVKVFQGTYTSPPFTLSNIAVFRPVISGITSPIALFLLFVGLMIMIAFLVIWIFLLIRKASAEIKNSMAKWNR